MCIRDRYNITISVSYVGSKRFKSFKFLIHPKFIFLSAYVNLARRCFGEAVSNERINVTSRKFVVLFSLSQRKCRSTRVEVRSTDSNLVFSLSHLCIYYTISNAYTVLLLWSTSAYIIFVFIFRHFIVVPLFWWIFLKINTGTTFLNGKETIQYKIPWNKFII